MCDTCGEVSVCVLCVVSECVCLGGGRVLCGKGVCVVEGCVLCGR